MDYVALAKKAGNRSFRPFDPDEPKSGVRKLNV